MRVLIVGKDSYIGNHLDAWLTEHGHEVFQLDVLREDWRIFDFSPYKSIIHVAGIVHRPNCVDWQLYKSVNTDMPIAIAQRAKGQGVQSYVYFSTMGVYGVPKKLSQNVIDEGTALSPTSMYDRSKFLGEEGLAKLADSSFNVAIVRPPSVYGKDCRGGYITGFTRIARAFPVLPRAYANARQSFIYIDNLCECVRHIVEKNLKGVFCPQDDEIPNANELISAISTGIGRKYHDSYLLGSLMRLVSFIPLVKKAYGGIAYSRTVSEMKDIDYVVVPFKEGIRRTVSK